MKVSFNSKMRKNAGSMITVVPSALVKILKAESGADIIWTLEIDGTGTPRVIVEFKDKFKE